MRTSCMESQAGREYLCKAGRLGPGGSNCIVRLPRDNGNRRNWASENDGRNGLSELDRHVEQVLKRRHVNAGAGQQPRGKLHGSRHKHCSRHNKKQLHSKQRLLSVYAILCPQVVCGLEQGAAGSSAER